MFSSRRERFLQTWTGEVNPRPRPNRGCCRGCSDARTAVETAVTVTMSPLACDPPFVYNSVFLVFFLHIWISIIFGECTFSAQPFLLQMFQNGRRSVLSPKWRPVAKTEFVEQISLQGTLGLIFYFFFNFVLVLCGEKKSALAQRHSDCRGFKPLSSGNPTDNLHTSRHIHL